MVFQGFAKSLRDNINRFAGTHREICKALRHSPSHALQLKANKNQPRRNEGHEEEKKLRAPRLFVVETLRRKKIVTTKLITGRAGLMLLAIFIGVYYGATLAQESAPQQHHKRQYRVIDLPSLDGTRSQGNSVNNRGWVAGFSRLQGDQSRRAALWRDGLITDLGTLGGPNSSVAWTVKNNRGIIVGISQTATPEPLGERWSCSAFFTGPDDVGYTCLGFVWEKGVMRALPTLGGNNGFAASANNRGQVVGWAENTVRDSKCVAPQVLQFRAVVWELGRDNIKIEELPLIPGDSSSAATAINNRGQVVGISGICDQAVGRHTARHAALWEKGEVIDLGNIGAEHWVTPTAINEQGDVVGFASVRDSDPNNPTFHAFRWTKRDGIQDLGALPGDDHSEAYGINEGGQIVGLSCGANGCRAFLWEDGVMNDLNKFKGSYSANLEVAKDINDLGEITGRAFDATTNVNSAFLAIPKRR
jgi:probable HAF family extracellular repeat protein